MSISFNQVPANVRVPFMFVEFDSSKAQQGPALLQFKTLVMGQRLSSGTVLEHVPTLVSSEADARKYFGAGSQLHGMLAKYFTGDKVTQVVAIAADDHASGVAATAKLTFGGTATADGVISLYIGGRLITASVEVGDTDDDVSAAVVAAIQAEPLSYASAAVDGTDANEANLTAKNKGLCGNEIDLRLNHYETESLPAGITCSIAPFASGAQNPVMSTLIAALPETQYNVIVNPWTDAASLSALEVELADRWGPVRQNDGVMISAKLAALGTLTTLGNSRNSPHSSISGPAASGPHPGFEYAARIAAECARAGSIDPARPFQTLQLTGMLVPKESEQFTLLERNNLLYDGIATCKVDGSGSVMMIERQIMTYQTNAANAPDTAYLDMTTLMTLSYLRYSLRTRFATKFPRSKLADDGTRFGPGQAIVTPKIAKAEILALFAEWELAGLVENAAQFKRDLVVERNASDPSRLDMLVPPDLVNGFIVGATQIQFLL